MLNEDAFRRALAAAGLDAPVRWDEVATSTNDVARELAAAGAPAWTLVAAGHQTAGRGRAGRTWVDEPGRAVMLSVILRPALEPARVGLLSLAAGAAMAGAASEAAALDVRCKWPNDLLADGVKVGGILAEADLDGDAIRHVVVGVGVNLEAPDGVADAAGIGAVDEERLVTAFVRELASTLEGDPAAILEAWRARADTLGRRVEATTVDGTVVRGLARDVDATGGLLVEVTDGDPVRIAFGDVRHLRPEGAGP
ncbi:MAG TPA: biotin--[acetyl-CoA-carboxylase] ligase [Actinomycetota bacterium]